MSRTVNQDEYVARRNEILDATQRLLYTKGYDQIAIQDILDELKISKGAFYHYFDSKGAMLEALAERMIDQVEPLLLPIIEDPHLPALEKLQRYFNTAARWKTDRIDYLLALLRGWYADENATVRQKVYATGTRRLTPMLAVIIRQGVQEGILKPAYPDQVGDAAWSLLYGMSEHLAEQIFSGEQAPDTFQRMQAIVATYTDALERVLGAPTGSFQLADPEMLRAWVSTPNLVA
jgi:AcrR family transcriptional regulator